MDFIKTAKFFVSTLALMALLFSANFAKAAESPAPAPETQKIRVVYFYASDCPNCQKIKPFIDEVAEKYKDKIDFLEHDVKDKEEYRQLFFKFIEVYNIPASDAKVPLIFIVNDYLLGVKDIQTNLESKIEENLAKKEALSLDCRKFMEDWEKNGGSASSGPGAGSGSCSISATDDSCSVTSGASQPSGKTKPSINLTIPSVIAVGFAAGFNPCLLAILAFIASVALATTGKRRNVLMIVFVFASGIFVTYLVVGIGLLRIVDQSIGLQAIIKSILIAIVGALGIWHVYDAYHLRKNEESSFHTPKAFVRLTESVTKKASLPAAFFIGALFSLIKAPCVGAIYLVILDMARSGNGTGIMYLAAYNFGVVLPVLVLGAAIAFGLNPEKVEKFRKEKRSALRLITGIILLATAASMYAGII